MLIPRQGGALVRAVTTETKLPGSAIYLLDATVERMVGQQMELLAMGLPPERDDPEPWETEVDTLLQSLPKPSWVLVKPWSYIEADQPKTYLVPQDAILAVLH
jgi:hypothetical protein